jgi:subtilisin
MEKPKMSQPLIVISIVVSIVVTFMSPILSGYASAQNLPLNNNTTTIEKSTFSSSPAQRPIIPSRNETIITNETMLREQEAQIIPNQYIVKLKENELTNTTIGLNTILQNLTTEIENVGTEVLYVYKSAIKGFAIKAPFNNETLSETLAILEMNPHVELIVQDESIPVRSQILPFGIDRVAGDQSPTLSGNNGGFDVNADIAIIDSGIDLDHIDLIVYRNINFLTTPHAEDFHATHVAGIAAAKDNQEGAVGMAPGARLWAIEACDNLGCNSSALLKAIDYVTNNKEEIDVVNISEGCTRIQNRSNTCGPGIFDLLQNATSNSAQQGVIYTVAAGNDGQDAKDDWPASNPDVITVSAMQDFDGKCGGLALHPETGVRGLDDIFWPQSNFGPDIDVAAPGVYIYSTIPNNSYYTATGTSMAAPHVAGFVALYKSYNPEATLSEIRSIIHDIGSYPSTFCDGYGHGEYFTGDPDNFREPLLYAKPIEQFTIYAEGQIESDSLNLLAQGHYICGPNAIATTRDPGIIFNGFLEGQLTDARYPHQPADLGKITVDATKDIRDVNTIIVVYSEDQTIRLRLVFQGTIDCSQPISQPVINAIDGTICVVSPTWALCGPISSASLGLR